jgi:hypothetical protein
MVHRTVSPSEMLVTAVVRMPPVMVVLQSTNPMSLGVDPPQGAVMSPISTSTVAAWVENDPKNMNIKNPIKINHFFILFTSLLL